jgi:hypothetical protein
MRGAHSRAATFGIHETSRAVSRARRVRRAWRRARARRARGERGEKNKASGAFARAVACVAMRRGAARSDVERAASTTDRSTLIK